MYSRKIFGLGLLATLVVVLFLHSVASIFYCKLTLIRLVLVAEVAARSGAEYLPDRPREALGAADRYVESNGSESDEIVNTIVNTMVSADRCTLTITIKHQIPEYMRLFAVGPPGGALLVSASAIKPMRHAFSTIQEARRERWSRNKSGRLHSSVGARVTIRRMIVQAVG